MKPIEPDREMSMAEITPLKSITLANTTKKTVDAATEKKLVRMTADGLHPALLGIANHLALTNHDPNVAYKFMMTLRSPDDRAPSSEEIQNVIHKAFEGNQSSKSSPSTARSKDNKVWSILDEKLQKKVIAESQVATPEALTLRWGCCQKYTFDILSEIFEPEDFVVLGQTTKGNTCGTFGEWVNSKRELEDFPFFVPALMKGRRGLTQKNTPSGRCNNNVLRRIFLIVEFDNLNTAGQMAIIYHLAGFAPLRYVIHSGGKSYHAAFEVRNQTEDQLREFMDYAVRLGADKALFTPCQFARTPGATRDNGNEQKVIVYRTAEEAASNDWDLGKLKQMSPRVTLPDQKGDAKRLNLSFASLIASTDENLEQMKKHAKDAVFILDEIALAGDLTIINASPGTGKTLLTLWLLSKRNIKLTKGYAFYYVNADDTFNGSIDKCDLMESFGVHSLVPGQKGFDTSDLGDLMEQAVEGGEANQTVLILDTLKKFVDMMDKRSAREICLKLRVFTQAGGTIIALAHTNKHKGNDGKSIVEGVGDFLNDFDCCYVIDEEKSEQGVKAVCFENKKLRGPNSLHVHFTYDCSEKKSWRDRFNSIKRVGNEEALTLIEQVEVREAHEADMPIINYLLGRLGDGALSRHKLKRVDSNSFSQGARERVLDRYDNSNPDLLLRHFTVSMGSTGGQIYSVACGLPPLE